jgi:hypothetical protein
VPDEYISEPEEKGKRMAANPKSFSQLVAALSEVLYDDTNSSRYDSSTILSALALTTMKAITGIAQAGEPDSEAIHRTMQRLAEQFGHNLRESAEINFRELYGRPKAQLS